MKTIHDQEKGQLATITTIVVLAVLVIGGIWLYQNANVDTTGDNLTIATPNGDDRDENLIEQLDEESATLVGQSVTVRGEVATVYDRNSFQLAEAGPDFVEGEVLVISRNPLPEQLLEDIDDVVDEEEIVTVQGTVQRLVITEIERELGLDLDPELEAELEANMLVIVADQVTVVSENTTGDTTNSINY